ncbi:MAG: hypothetical protein JW793_15170 [Acidobacteria bacterium]|nr:hypothetical protein [Acidobacteriota bacterium]
MSDVFSFFILVLCGFIPAVLVQKIASQKFRILEKELEDVCAALSQMAELQVRSYRKHASLVDNLEERIMELNFPSDDSRLPLERRHQVLTLARRGVNLDDIVRRLKAPVGEAELILNLGEYAKNANTCKVGNGERGKHYA